MNPPSLSWISRKNRRFKFHVAAMAIIVGSSRFALVSMETGVVAYIPWFGIHQVLGVRCWRVGIHRFRMTAEILFAVPAAGCVLPFDFRRGFGLAIIRCLSLSVGGVWISG